MNNPGYEDVPRTSVTQAYLLPTMFAIILIILGNLSRCRCERLQRFARAIVILLDTRKGFRTFRGTFLPQKFDLPFDA